MKSNLTKPDLGIEPQIDLDLGEGIPSPTAQLAGQLGDQLEDLADRVVAICGFSLPEGETTEAPE